jgi:hypothetical protein
MSRRDRDRGHDWEREVVRRLREVDPTARTARELAPLEDPTGRDVITRLPLAVQCKAGRTVGFIAGLLEAEHAASLVASAGGPRDQMPIAAVNHYSSRRRVVVMRLDDWINLLRLAFLKDHAPGCRCSVCGRSARTSRDPSGSAAG